MHKRFGVLMFRAKREIKFQTLPVDETEAMEVIGPLPASNNFMTN